MACNEVEKVLTFKVLSKLLCIHMVLYLWNMIYERIKAVIV